MNDSIRHRWAVIFDFDGVIANTEPLHHRSFQSVLEPFGLSFDWQDYLSSFVGYDDRKTFQMVFRKARKNLDARRMNELIRDKAREFLALVDSGSDLIYAGVPELVQDCLEAGSQLGICSGALLGDIRGVLKRGLLIDAFEQIVTAEDVSVGKPDPEGYCLALLRMGIMDTPTVAIEDTPAGIASAISAGVAVVAITTTHKPAALQRANLVLDSIQELSAERLRHIARSQSTGSC